MRECLGVAGFVLVGGQSRRMGRDKALLTGLGGTLVAQVALQVREAASTVTLLGDPAKYGYLGFPVVADVVTGCGPMAGLHAALLAIEATDAERVLIVACDLPNVDAAFLKRLLDHRQARCVAARSDRGLEPLCAVYHQNTLAEVDAAVRDGRLRMRDLVAQLSGIGVEVDPRLVRNVNTEEDWQMHLTENK